MSQIDFFLIRKVDRGCCMDCKVIPGESVVIEHRLLILKVRISRRFRKIKRKLDPKIKWWRLKEGGVDSIRDQEFKLFNDAFG